MKKIFSTILIFAFTFSLAGPAMAKGAKAPKNLCLENSGIYLNISTSKGGKTTLGEIKISTYNVQGVLIVGMSPWPNPVSGSGFMMEDTFVFNFTSVFPSGSLLISIDGQVAWGVGAPIAGGLTMFHLSTGMVDDDTITWDIVDCDEYVSTGP